MFMSLDNTLTHACTGIPHDEDVLGRIFLLVDHVLIHVAQALDLVDRRASEEGGEHERDGSVRGNTVLRLNISLSTVRGSLLQAYKHT